MRQHAHLGVAQNQLRTKNRLSFIRSIQRGTITLNNVTSNTATVTAVDPTHAVLHFLGCTDSIASVGKHLFSLAIVLTNATTITATVNTPEVASHIVGYELIEYWPGILKSVQRGVITCAGATSATATITAVNPFKAQVLGGGFTCGDSTATGIVAVARLDLTNATTVTFVQPGAIGTYLAPWQVVEWF